MAGIEVIRKQRKRRGVLRTRIDIFGLLGFTASGVLFVISALRSGDTVSLAGSVVWIVSCIGWIGALVFPSTRQERPETVEDNNECPGVVTHSS